jgi:hypothetical protein
MEDRMTIRRTGAILAVWILVFLAAALVAGQKPNQADVQLKAAMNKELVDGDLKGAIELYQKIIATSGGNRNIVAQALVQMGQCYEKLGQKEARSAYERVLREFSDQSEPARLARQRLAALAPAPAPVGAPAASPEMTVRRVWSQHGTLATVAGPPSPDGHYLPYYNGDMGDIWVHDFTTGQNRRLFLKKGDWDSNEEATNPVFAPDGRRIAHTWFNTKSYELRVSDLDGAQPRVIYSNRTIFRPAPRTPDATSLPLHLRGRRSGDCRVIGGRRIVARSRRWEGAPQAGLSPDGRYVAYEPTTWDGSRQRDVFTIEVATGREAPCRTRSRRPGARLDARRPAAPVQQRPSGARDAWAIDVAAGCRRRAAIVKDLGACSPRVHEFGDVLPRIPGMSREVYTATVDFADRQRPDLRARAAPLDRLEPQSRLVVGRAVLAFTSLRRPRNDRFIVFQSAKTGEERDVKLVMKDATPRFGLRWAPMGAPC